MTSEGRDDGAGGGVPVFLSFFLRLSRRRRGKHSICFCLSRALIKATSTHQTVITESLPDVDAMTSGGGGPGGRRAKAPPVMLEEALSAI